jgi:hypothetical protein
LPSHADLAAIADVHLEMTLQYLARHALLEPDTAPAA